MKTAIVIVCLTSLLVDARGSLNLRAPVQGTAKLVVDKVAAAPAPAVAAAPSPGAAASPAAAKTTTTQTTTTPWHESGVMDAVSPKHNIDEKSGMHDNVDGKNFHDVVAENVKKQEEATNKFGFGK
mmetsp:Transcript_10586/g.17323  ORF Transcript_10586/g.17323 Transcript_10586/m.17323 type:complete len:126 (-) Transcript_10586:74-451(-)